MAKIRVQAGSDGSRCQSDTSDHFRRSRDYSDESMRCKRKGFFLVGGVLFCRPHAADAVLSHVLEGQEVVKCS